MAHLVDTDFPLPEGDPDTWGTEDDIEQKAMTELLAASDALPEHEVIGRVLRWPRGDGQAFYLVLEDHPLTLQWIPFGDRWHVEDALIKGLDLEEVRKMVAQHNAFRQLFGRK